MVIHPSYYDACDVIYYVIAVRAHMIVRIFVLPYLGNRSKSSYELFSLESHILSFPRVLQISPESPCMCMYIYVKLKQSLCGHITAPEGSRRLKLPDFQTIGT
jgi:hypothetical protein